MRKVLLALLVNISTAAIAQTFTDSTVIAVPTGYIRFATTYQSAVGNPNDSIITINAARRRALVSPLQLPISTAQAAAIALKSSIHVGIDAGANDSYVITATPVPTSYTVGMVVILKANTVNTGAASINVNGLGVKNIVKRVSTVLANGDIPALSFKMLVYDGTNFTLLNPVVN